MVMIVNESLSYGCTGPMLRGSLDKTKGDPDWDLRKTEPYSGYEQYQFDIPIPPFDTVPRDAVIGRNFCGGLVRGDTFRFRFELASRGQPAGGYQRTQGLHAAVRSHVVSVECAVGRVGRTRQGAGAARARDLEPRPGRRQPRRSAADHAQPGEGVERG